MRERRFDTHRALFFRMNEFHHRRVQGLAFEVATGGAVNPIADQGATVMRGVDADLMLATGVQ